MYVYTKVEKWSAAGNCGYHDDQGNRPHFIIIYLNGAEGPKLDYLTR